jgi:uncharacterized protein RhaS with RHS repeats
MRTTKQANNYNYFRDYDPAVGKYVESDPIGLNGGLNTYAYVRQNPVQKDDPLGLCECAPGSAKYSNQTSAARAAIKAANPESILRDRERCGRVCKDRSTGKYFTTGPVWGTYKGCNSSTVPCPECSTYVARWHTHGGPNPNFNSEIFSGTDISNSDAEHVDNYVGTPSNQFLHYPANSGAPYSRGQL